MTDSPSPITLLRLMEIGADVNTWGTLLNTNQRILEQAAKGWQTQALTGDLTISWTQYTLANIGSCATLVLTGSLAAAATLTMPAYQNEIDVINSAGQTVTVKCSGGTGVAIPTSRRVATYCDGTDYYIKSSNYGGVTSPTSGSLDMAAYSAVEIAIASAGIPSSAGTVRVSLTDTTANYLYNKITVTGSLTKSIATPGGNESVNIDFTFDEGQTALYSGVMSL